MTFNPPSGNRDPLAIPSKPLSFIPGSLRLVLALFAIVVFVVSIVARVLYRGSYYPGWDALGPAHGLYLLSTKPFADTFTEVLYATRHFQIWTNISTVIYTLIPGILGSRWPWEYWGHVLTFVLFLLTLRMIAKSLGMPLDASWLVLLAVSTSPALLSFSVAGYPFVTGFLPHAVALWVTLDERLRQRWLLTLTLSLAAVELSWHLYPLGKTLFTVFLLAAVLHRGVPLLTRGMWILVSALQLAMIFHFSSSFGAFWRWEDIGVSKIYIASLHVANALFVTRMLAIPLLFATGMASFFFFKKNRLFLFGLLMAQLALVVVLALGDPSFIRPRRFLMVEFYCVVAIMAMLLEGDAGSRLRLLVNHAFIALLVGGNLWQLHDMLNYMKVPVQQQSHPLPYTYSQADYVVQKDAVEWAHELRSRVEAGEKLILVYNFRSYPENTTDMAAVLERLYLHLGHDRFVDSVFAFGDLRCRYTCLPIRPIRELEAFLDTIRPGTPTPPESFIGYYTLTTVPGSWFSGGFTVESAVVFREIRKRFVIELKSPKNTYHMRFRIAPKPDGPMAWPSFMVQFDRATYEGTPGKKPLALRGFPIDMSWYDRETNRYDTPMKPYLVERPWSDTPFSLHFAGTLHVFESGHYSFILGSDDSARVWVAGNAVIDLGGNHPFHLLQRTMVLGKGTYPMDIEYEDFGGVARLFADIQRIDEGSPVVANDVIYQTVSVKALFPTGLTGTYYAGVNWTGDNKSAGEEIHLGESLKAQWKAALDAPSNKPWPSQDSFSLRLEGEMEVPKTGIYRMVLGSDDGSTIYLNGVPVLDNGGVHAYEERTAMVPLQAGKVPFRLDYSDAMIVAKLRLSVQRVVTGPFKQ